MALRWIPSTFVLIWEIQIILSGILERKKLFGGTVSPNNLLFGGTVANDYPIQVLS